MVSMLIYVLVVLIIFWVLWYMVSNMVPEPLRRPATVILVVLGAILLIYLLLQFAGGGLPGFGHHPLLR